MPDESTLRFDSVDICKRLSQMTEPALDELEFGVIGFDAETVVRLYNVYESEASGLSSKRVLNEHLFNVGEIRGNPGE